VEDRDRRWSHFCQIRPEWGMVSFEPYTNTKKGTKELTMSPLKRYANKQIKARKRLRLKAQERLLKKREQAQHSIEVLHQAIKDLDSLDTLVAEIEGRLRAKTKTVQKLSFQHNP
jgi:hypothetical protein